jgi:hypothetical protein
MSGTATLTRAQTAAPSTFATSLAPPPRLASLRGALVVATFAMAFMSTETAKQVVLSFDGTVSTLGKVNSYWDGSATLLGWLLATAALYFAYRASAALGASRAVRVGVSVAAIGTVLLALAAACSVWATAVYNHATIGGGGVLSFTRASTVTHEVVELSKASLAFQAAGFLVLAVGLFTARPEDSRVGSAWQRVLAVLGAAALLAAVAPGVSFILVLQGRSTTSGQLSALMTTVPPVLSWLAVAVALLFAARALASSERTARLGVAAPIGALGAVVLAISSTAVVALDELVLESTGSGWLTNVTRINTTAAWVGWLALTVAFGVAATRLKERQILATSFAQGR